MKRLNECGCGCGGMKGGCQKPEGSMAKHDAMDVALTLRIQAKRENANNGKIVVLSVSLDCNDRLRIAGDERANALEKIPIPSFASLLIKNTEIERASAERGGSKKREIMLPKKCEPTRT